MTHYLHLHTRNYLNVLLSIKKFKYFELKLFNNLKSRIKKNIYLLRNLIINYYLIILNLEIQLFPRNYLTKIVNLFEIILQTCRLG